MTKLTTTIVTIELRSTGSVRKIGKTSFWEALINVLPAGWTDIEIVQAMAMATPEPKASKKRSRLAEDEPED